MGGKLCIGDREEEKESTQQDIFEGGPKELKHIAYSDGGERKLLKNESPSFADEKSEEEIDCLNKETPSLRDWAVFGQKRFKSERKLTRNEAETIGGTINSISKANTVQFGKNGQFSNLSISDFGLGNNVNRSFEVSIQGNPMNKKAIRRETENSNMNEILQTEEGLQERHKIILDTEELNLAEAFQNIDRDRDGIIHLSDMIREVKHSHQNLSEIELRNYVAFISQIMPYYCKVPGGDSWRFEEFVCFMHDAANLEKRTRD